jgi:predicted ATP-grasp superfamily ATP-dependent carboligase
MHNNEVRRDNLQKEKEQYEEELKKMEQELEA